uniref:Uncharacterized protein n=1 Tax=Cacopsylla melanoneura TaxID=428564 RepID=A0A8D9BK74_9HEMI
MVSKGVRQKNLTSVWLISNAFTVKSRWEDKLPTGLSKRKRDGNFFYPQTNLKGGKTYFPLYTKGLKHNVGIYLSVHNIHNYQYTIKYVCKMVNGTLFDNKIPTTFIITHISSLRETLTNHALGYEFD